MATIENKTRLYAIPPRKISDFKLVTIIVIGAYA